jgi:hypothetical protein
MNDEPVTMDELWAMVHQLEDQVEQLAARSEAILAHLVAAGDMIGERFGLDVPLPSRAHFPRRARPRCHDK